MSASVPTPPSKLATSLSTFAYHTLQLKTTRFTLFVFLPAICRRFAIRQSLCCVCTQVRGFAAATATEVLTLARVYSPSRYSARSQHDTIAVRAAGAPASSETWRGELAMLPARCCYN